MLIFLKNNLFFVVLSYVMMLQRVFKMCIHSLRHSNKRSTHSLPRLKYKMLPGHQLALFYIFITYCHGFNIFFKTMFLRLTGQWLCGLFLLVASLEFDL